MTRRSRWFVLLPALLAACHADTPADRAARPPALATLRGTWLLLPEAQAGGDTLVYRRNTYRFRNRPEGRPGFRLGEGGRFTRYRPVPGGGLLAQDGTWTSTRSGRLRVVLFPPVDTTFELRVIRYRDGELRLRMK